MRLIGWIAAIHFLLHACAAQLVLPIPGSVDTMESADGVNASTLSPWKEPREIGNSHFYMFTSFVALVCASAPLESTRTLGKYKSSALPKSAGGVTVKQKANKRITQMQLWQDSMFSFFLFFSFPALFSEYRVPRSVCAIPTGIIQQRLNPNHFQTPPRKRKQTTRPTRERDNYKSRNRIGGTLRLS